MSFNPQTPARERTPFGNFELNRTHLKTKVTRVPYADEGSFAVDAETAHQATLTACEHALDVADARELLAMLGLRGDEGLDTPGDLDTPESV